ncbi:precorrin 3B synthase CobZ [Rhodomicrobium vannielii ATCC 17100]|uniref:Precorrin 3B synthase CobZ n=1 Tax=Rhodomicrobium vannielii (strain ATCC 17100 / DSM 162 / LMG 4299 / NCIMB 10020 / ATH 3.1.1) TaxID=648757 RepID=E3I5K6_RHOVT|nr:FAD-dependent tricarballylate dehydrogenase TcuA [Rhodomicrobium vannielii]ADP72817.1 precorrin 3B synthase CobZ [Rhodomicrobium vannielii ATCC 17100]
MTGALSEQVLVIGGGLAALAAAISARRAGARVTMLEAAPHELRGGNTRHSRNLRIAHDKPTAQIPGSYCEDEFLADLAKASDGRNDAGVSRLLVHASTDLPDWLAAQGAMFQTQDIPYSRKTAFFLGGGKAAVNALYATAERLGVRIHYGAQVDSVDLESGAAGPFHPRATVLACGGAQAAMPTTMPGFINRGTPYAQGEILRAALAQGAAAVGDAGAAHLVAVDARSPEADGGIVTRVDGMEHGMAVDARGARFADETAVTGPTRYATWGRLVADLPERRAALVLDADGIERAPLSIFPPLEAPTLAELAARIGADAATLEASARESSRVARPPFYAFPIRPGITFTCLGLRVDETARVVLRDGSACANVFAAGMIMAPNVLGTGYVAGGGMTVGAVFGRIAGEEAARHALS